jgi:hypothetical protein
MDNALALIGPITEGQAVIVQLQRFFEVMRLELLHSLNGK